VDTQCIRDFGFPPRLLELLDPQSSYSPRGIREYKKNSRFRHRRDRLDAQQTLRYVIVLSVLPDTREPKRASNAAHLRNPSRVTTPGLSVARL